LVSTTDGQDFTEVIYTTVILLLEQLCTSLAVQEINNNINVYKIKRYAHPYLEPRYGLLIFCCHGDMCFHVVLK